MTGKKFMIIYDNFDQKKKGKIPNIYHMRVLMSEIVCCLRFIGSLCI